MYLKPQKNAQLAGLSTIKFEQRQLTDIVPAGDSGKIICNPPYGQRLGNNDDIEALYPDMGNIFMKNSPVGHIIY